MLEAVNTDLSYWKVASFIELKNREHVEYNNLSLIVAQNFEMLNFLYVILFDRTAGGITWNQIIQFCRSANIVNDTLHVSNVDRNLLATKVGVMMNLPTTALVRFEFLEFLVRMADSKYSRDQRDLA